MANKTLTIKGATDKELDELLIRLRKEGELQNLIAELKRKGSPIYLPYDNPQISTEEAIDSLYHVGVLGMKWGKRGKRKFAPRAASKLHQTIKDKTAKKESSEDHKKKVILKKKQIHEMSNAELKTLNERLQLEKQYKQLRKEDVVAGQKFATDMLRDIGKEIAKESIKETIKSTMRGR